MRNIEPMLTPELDLKLRLAEKDSGIHDASPHDFQGQIKIFLLSLCVERRAGLLLIIDTNNRAILDRPNARIPRGTPARERTAIEEVAVDRRRLKLNGRDDGSHSCLKTETTKTCR